MKNAFFLPLLIVTLLFTKNLTAQDCPDSCAYFIPNSITPDCDAVGCEMLEIRSSCPFTKFEFTIFNRWGEVLFESVDPKIKFDCSEHKEGTYTWKLKGEFCNGKVIDDLGNVTIIR